MRVATPVRRVVPVIFPDALCHDIVAKAFAQALEEHNWRPVEVVSAGEILMSVHDVEGDSETLKTKSREQDADIISNYNYTHGIE